MKNVNIDWAASYQLLREHEQDEGVLEAHGGREALYMAWYQAMWDNEEFSALAKMS